MPETPPAIHSYGVVGPSLDGFATIMAPEISQMFERHYFELPVARFRPASSDDILAEGASLAGIVFVLEQGLPTRLHLGLLRQLQGRGVRTLLAWPSEKAIEVIDRERLSSLRRHWAAAIVANRLKAWRRGRAKASTVDQTTGSSTPTQVDVEGMAALADLVQREAESLHAHLSGGVEALRSLGMPKADALVVHFAAGLTVLERVRAQTEGLKERIATLRKSGSVACAERQSRAVSDAYDESSLNEVRIFLRDLIASPRPQTLALDHLPQPGNPLPGTGVYLRLDFWAQVSSGGSYGHTCYQARALARTCRDFVCLMANPLDLLNRLGVRQVSLPSRGGSQLETNLLGMNLHYRERLAPVIAALRPAFIFERIVLGNAVGAWISREFGIPYIVEYNGSEISLKRSFQGGGYMYEDLLVEAELAAFRQATLISVVSDHVADDVARRGIPHERILVNPNAVDLDAYAPLTSATERDSLRKGLGFEPCDRVVGFIGTFGGWHGIDVLAEALPRIVRADESVRVLLIGDGHLKPLVRDAVAAAGIQDRVVDVGRVSQERGAELLRACDILVSPHSRNMIDSPFFGSPTKLFEYMAMGAGIVASDLEQIGQVLSPALTNREIAAARAIGRPIAVGECRAVLCRPGDVEEFSQAVLTLVRDRELCGALGRNARAAAEQYYSWDQHVRNLWLTLSGRPAEGYWADRRKGR